MLLNAAKKASVAYAIGLLACVSSEEEKLVLSVL